MVKRSLFLLGIGVATLGSAGPVQAISFIESPTAYCRRIAANQCVINWGYMSVSASPNYIVGLWIFVREKLVYHANGFFQQSMYIDNRFLGDGIPVNCGAAGATPPPDPNPIGITYGNSYSWRVNAEDSGGLRSANYGTVVCPPRVPRL
jgi:hypothetical protein